MASASPITEFQNALERATAHQVDTAPVALGTVDADGRPSVRMVLLRGVDERGFVFHTNYTSRKGRELDANPNAALCFHWPTLDEQIRIEGTVRRLPQDESDASLDSRPRGSQLGAWALAQSQVLPNREQLEEEYRATELRFAAKPYRGRRSGVDSGSSRGASSSGTGTPIVSTIAWSIRVRETAGELSVYIPSSSVRGS